jgi:hypothetical protein
VSVEQEAARLERYREFILRPTTDTWRESKRLRVGHLMELFRVVMDHGWGAGLDTLVRIDTVNAQHRRIGADLIDRWYRADPRTAWKADAGLPFFEEQCQWAQGSGGTVRNWLSLIRRVEGDHTTLCGFVVDDEGLKAMSPVMVASMVERMRIPQPEGERLIGHGEFIASPGLRYAGGHVPPLH